MRVRGAAAAPADAELGAEPGAVVARQEVPRLRPSRVRHQEQARRLSTRLDQDIFLEQRYLLKIPHLDDCVAISVFRIKSLI